MKFSTSSRWDVKVLPSFLEKWKHQKNVIYVLDRQYTQPGLKLKSLQGEDYFRVQTLQNLAGDDFEVRLATIEQDGTSLRLKRVVDLDGNEVASNVRIDKDTLLQKEPFESRKRKRNSEEAASARKEDSSSGQSTLHKQRVRLEGSPFATNTDILGYGARSVIVSDGVCHIRLALLRLDSYTSADPSYLCYVSSSTSCFLRSLVQSA